MNLSELYAIQEHKELITL